MGVNLRDAVDAEAVRLSESAPVVDVWDGHVIKATGDAVGFAAAHHRNVNDLGDFAGKNAGKMTYAAGVFRFGKQGHFPFGAFVIEIAPDEFSDERRAQHCFGIVTVARRNRLHLITVRLRSITRLGNSA